MNKMHTAQETLKLSLIYDIFQIIKDQYDPRI